LAKLFAAGDRGSQALFLRCENALFLSPDDEETQFLPVFSIVTLRTLLIVDPQPTATLIINSAPDKVLVINSQPPRKELVV
jgi:hypothetical protein